MPDAYTISLNLLISLIILPISFSHFSHHLTDSSRVASDVAKLAVMPWVFLFFASLKADMCSVFAYLLPSNVSTVVLLTILFLMRKERSAL